MVGSCAHGAELSGSIGSEYLDKMRKYCVSFLGRTLLHVIGWLVSWLVKCVYFRIPLVSLHAVRDSIMSI